MTEPRDIPIGDILSLVGDKLMSRNEVASVFEALTFLTGDSDSPPNATLRNRDNLRAYLIARHPTLADWNDAEVTTENWQEKLAEAVAIYGETLPLAPMPPGVWERLVPDADISAQMGQKMRIPPRTA